MFYRYGKYVLFPVSLSTKWGRNAVKSVVFCIPPPPPVRFSGGTTALLFFFYSKRGVGKRENREKECKKGRVRLHPAEILPSLWKRWMKKML